MDFIRKNMHYSLFFFFVTKFTIITFIVGLALTGLMSELQL